MHRRWRTGDAILYVRRSAGQLAGEAEAGEDAVVEARDGGDLVAGEGEHEHSHRVVHAPAGVAHVEPEGELIRASAERSGKRSTGGQQERTDSCGRAGCSAARRVGLERELLREGRLRAEERELPFRHALLTPPRMLREAGELLDADHPPDRHGVGVAYGDVRPHAQPDVERERRLPHAGRVSTSTGRA